MTTVTDTPTPAGPTLTPRPPRKPPNGTRSINPPRPAAPRHYFPDEEPEPESVSHYGYSETDELHGYCRFCGHHGHTHLACPNRPDDFLVKP